MPGVTHPGRPQPWRCPRRPERWPSRPAAAGGAERGPASCYRPSVTIERGQGSGWAGDDQRARQELLCSPPGEVPALEGGRGEGGRRSWGGGGAEGGGLPVSESPPTVLCSRSSDPAPGAQAFVSRFVAGPWAPRAQQTAAEFKTPKENGHHAADLLQAPRGPF